MNHILDRKAHRTICAAGMAMGAFVRSRSQLQGWPFAQIPQLSVKNHKRRHPANMMTKRPLTDCKSRCRDQEKNHEIGYECIHIADGKSKSRLVKDIYLVIAFAFNGEDDDGAYLGYPDHPFHPVAFCHSFFSHQRNGLLASRSGTNPPAKSPAQDERKGEQ
jgi:hypothetical protein